MIALGRGEDGVRNHESKHKSMLVIKWIDQTPMIYAMHDNNMDNDMGTGKKLSREYNSRVRAYAEPGCGSTCHQEFMSYFHEFSSSFPPKEA